MWRWRVASVSETGIYKTTDFADFSDYYLSVYYCHLWMNLGNLRNPWLKWKKAVADTARTDATMWLWRVASVSETGIYKTTDFADFSDYYLAVYYCHLWMNLGNPRNPWLK